MVKPSIVRKPINVSGYGHRIRQAILDRASALGRSYRDAEFARDIGMLLRGKPMGRSTLADWISERNQPSLEAWVAMEQVLERPGLRAYLAFGVWPDANQSTPPASLPQLGLGAPVTPAQVGELTGRPAKRKNVRSRKR